MHLPWTWHNKEVQLQVQQPQYLSDKSAHQIHVFSGCCTKVEDFITMYQNHIYCFYITYIYDILYKYMHLAIVSDEDEDGDHITVRSDDEMQDMFSAVSNKVSLSSLSFLLGY